MHLFYRFLKNESGVAAIEYGIITGMMSIILVTVLSRVAVQLNATFSQIAVALR